MANVPADVAPTVVHLPHRLRPTERSPAGRTRPTRTIEGSAPARLDGGIELVDTSDADEEVREVVRRIVAAADHGVPFERIAVVWPVERSVRPAGHRAARRGRHPVERPPGRHLARAAGGAPGARRPRRRPARAAPGGPVRRAGPRPGAHERRPARPHGPLGAHVAGRRAGRRWPTGTSGWPTTSASRRARGHGGRGRRRRGAARLRRRPRAPGSARRPRRRRGATGPPWPPTCSTGGSAGRDASPSCPPPSTRRTTRSRPPSSGSAVSTSSTSPVTRRGLRRRPRRRARRCAGPRRPHR